MTVASSKLRFVSISENTWPVGPLVVSLSRVTLAGPRRSSFHALQRELGSGSERFNCFSVKRSPERRPSGTLALF